MDNIAKRECILKFGDLPLDTYLKAHGKGLNNVDEFLAIYEIVR